MDNGQTAGDGTTSTETASEQTASPSEGVVVGSIAPAPDTATPQDYGDQTASEAPTASDDTEQGGSFVTSLATLPGFATTEKTVALAKIADEQEIRGMQLAEALEKIGMVTAHTKGNPRFIRALYVAAQYEAKAEVEFLLAKLDLLAALDATFETAGIDAATPDQVQAEYEAMVAEVREQRARQREAYKAQVMAQLAGDNPGRRTAAPAIVQ